MKRTVFISLATFVAVFFFALSLTLTISGNAIAGPECCSSCPPSCEQIYDGRWVLVGGDWFCERVGPNDPNCYKPYFCNCY